MKMFNLQILFIVFIQRNLADKIINDENNASSALEIQALLDYNTGFIFYKDLTIPACFAQHFLRLSGDIPIFKVPLSLASNDSIRANNPASDGFMSATGSQFCHGLPFYHLEHFQEPEAGNFISNKRRKRQSNGYYRNNNAPHGEARAQSGWNPSGGASQAQVQGQVFGSGIFSGQAQTQNGGLSQSQVQLAGVGIRGQIASSSGNAQAQLALGNGAGSGQAAGLGQGPSSSQVQVNLGQQGEESMASASATSGGATAGIGGGHGGIPSSGGYVLHEYPQLVGSGRDSTSDGYDTRDGFYPGHRHGGGGGQYSPIGSSRLNGGAGRNYDSHQANFGRIQDGSLGQVPQGGDSLSGRGLRNGIADTGPGYRNGESGNGLGQGMSFTSPGLGSTSGISGTDGQRGLSQVGNGLGSTKGQDYVTRQNGLARTPTDMGFGGGDLSQDRSHLVYNGGSELSDQRLVKCIDLLQDRSI